MAYKYCYRIAYATAAHDQQPSKLIHVDIYDTTEADSTILVELEGAEEPFKVGADNEGEDKFTPIRGQKATIQFHSTQTVNLLTFMQGDDNRFLVDAYVVSTNKRLFKGFVVQDEISEAFMPSPNVVTLIAGDGLGLLKGEPLTDRAGKNPRGYFPVIQFIAWCLDKTALYLPIYVVNNIKEESDQTKIFYRTCYEWAKSFEAEINVSENCYDVLEHILGESCYISQYDGAWWIIRIDELKDEEVKAHKFTHFGVYETALTVNTDQFIGTGRAMYWINEDASIKPERAVKYIQETYNYEFPQEIVDNIDFSRGDQVAQDGNSYYYDIDDWQLAQWSLHNTATPVSLEANIYRQIIDGYEKERYVIMPLAQGTPQSGGFQRWVFIRSNAVPMGAGDKGSVSVDFKHNVANPSTALDESFMGISFKGASGKYYAYAYGATPADGFWLHKPIDTTITAQSYRYTDAAQTIEWQNQTIYFKAVPEDGELFIFLQANYGNDATQVKHYQNLRFDYSPYINGSYKKYDGQYHKISHGITSKKNREVDVRMSDSPKPLFKGAMFTYNGTKYVLAGRFYSSYDVDPPQDEHLHPYGHLQAYDVWNQHNRLMRVFEGTIQGLQVDGTLPGLIHKYRLTDITSHTVNKYFILLHGEFDWYKCEWRGTLAEVYDTSIPKDYDSPKEFKYVEG